MLVLAYHDIVPHRATQRGDASLHLPQADFARQLDVLQSTCDVVPLAALLGAVPEGRRPRVAITFDDAYEGALVGGLGELAQRSLPATVFVAPGILGSTPWWDRLAGPPNKGVPHAVRERALWELGGRSAAIASTLIADPANGALPRIGTLDELVDAVANPLISLASHTWSHVNLAAVPPDEVAREMESSLAWLRERFPSTLSMLSYPYGLYGPEVEAACARAGYSCAFRIDGGWVRDVASMNRFAIPRFNVPAGLSVDGFRLRLGGIGAV